MVELINISSAFTYGLSSSLALCLASCLPIYLPILFSHGENKGFRISIGFAIGRYAGYTFLGIIAAILGATFLDFFNNILPKISIWIIFIFGLFTIIFGILILVKKEINIKEKNCKTNITKLRTANNPLLASVSFGFISTITPCIPVFTFLLLPFAIGKNIGETVLITVAFGLGANIVFIILSILIGFGMKHLKEKFYRWKRKLEIFSVIFLIIFGLFYLFWSIGPLFFNWQYKNFILPTIFDFLKFIKYLII